MSLLLIRALLWIASLFTLAAAAAIDVRDRIIPNRLVLLIAATGLALGLVSRPGSVWVNLLTSAILLAGIGTLVHYQFLGGGDAKLIAAVTLLVPPDRIGLLLMEIAIAGGLLSAAYLGARRALRRAPISHRTANPVSRTNAFDRFLGSERARIMTGQSVPYALAILGGVGFYVMSELYQCFYATSCSF